MGKQCHDALSYVESFSNALYATRTLSRVICYQTLLQFTSRISNIPFYMELQYTVFRRKSSDASKGFWLENRATRLITKLSLMICVDNTLSSAVRILSDAFLTVILASRGNVYNKTTLTHALLDINQSILQYPSRAQRFSIICPITLKVSDLLNI